jgi:hypothetical protein
MPEYEVSVLHRNGAEESFFYEDIDAAVTHGHRLHKSGEVQDVEVVILRNGAAIRFDPPEDTADLLYRFKPNGEVISYE